MSEIDTPAKVGSMEGLAGTHDAGTTDEGNKHEHIATIPAASG